ncbi:MAG: PHP domain-containing protein [Desulfobacterales bacterium]
MNEINKILIEKPNLSALTRNYTAVDLHFHSKHSDGNSTVAEIAERAEKLNIGIAITDHNEIRGSIEISRYSDVLSIPGIEITSKEGAHILVYFHSIESLKTFFENDIKPYLGNDKMSSISLTLSEIIERANSFDSLTVFPHPFGSAYAGVCNSSIPKKQQAGHLKKIDGIEVLNASNLKRSNLRSAMLGFNLNKIVTGGSDGHSLSHMGKVVCYAKCEKNRKAFFDALKNRESRVIGKEINMLRKLTSHGMKLKTNFRNYQNIIEKNVRYGYVLINVKSKTMRENFSLKS